MLSSLYIFLSFSIADTVDGDLECRTNAGDIDVYLLRHENVQLSANQGENQMKSILTGKKLLLLIINVVLIHKVQLHICCQIRK